MVGEKYHRGKQKQQEEHKRHTGDWEPLVKPHINIQQSHRRTARKKTVFHHKRVIHKGAQGYIADRPRSIRGPREKKLPEGGNQRKTSQNQRQTTKTKPRFAQNRGNTREKKRGNSLEERNHDTRRREGYHRHSGRETHY